MGITRITCTDCKGSGRAERFDEFTIGGETFQVDDCMDDLTEALRDGVYPNAELHWIECACPGCGGDGEVTVEFFHPAVRIF